MDTGTGNTNGILGTLFDTTAYSDLTIICGDSEFAVHKNIVCTQSGFFRRACEKGRWQEGKSGVIKLETSDNPFDGDDPNDISLMISYLYLADYQPLSPPSLITPPVLEKDEAEIKNELPDAVQPNSRKCFLDVHARVFALGSKYDIPQLRQVSHTKFYNELQDSWQKPEFIDAITIAFNTAPDDNALRDTLRRTIVEEGGRLANEPDFEAVVGEIEGLGLALFKEKCLLTEARRTCADCRSTFTSQRAYDSCTLGEIHKCDLNGPCKPSKSSKPKNPWLAQHMQTVARCK